MDCENHMCGGGVKGMDGENYLCVCVCGGVKGMDWENHICVNVQ